MMSVTSKISKGMLSSILWGNERTDEFEISDHPGLERLVQCFKWALKSAWIGDLMVR